MLIRPLTRRCTARAAAIGNPTARRNFSQSTKQTARHSTSRINNHRTSINSSSSSLSLSSSSSSSSLSFGRRSFSSSSNKKILLWADHDGKVVHPSIFSVVTAAKTIDSNAEIIILVTGDAESVPLITSQISSLPVTSIMTVTNDIFTHLLPESLSILLSNIIKKENFNYLLLATSSNGKNILGRIGALLNSQPITDIIEIKSPDTFIRPIYAGNAIQTIQLNETIKLLSIRPTNFSKIENSSSSTIKATEYNDSESVKIDSSTGSEWVSEDLTVSERPDLGTARVVISGGRGMKSGDNFSLLTSLADTLHGAVGASRAAVDAGMVPNEYQVGQTGKVVAPDLYVAVGISGAIQHLAGMKDSKVIVAINKDSEAPIFQVADYGLADDLFKVVPELTKQIQAAK